MIIIGKQTCSSTRHKAVRRLHSVGGGAPVNFCRPRRRAAGPKRAAVVARRGQPRSNFKLSEKISFYYQNFLTTFFKSAKIEKKISTQQKWPRQRADKLSVATCRSPKFGGGALIAKSRRRRPQIVGAAARPAHGFNTAESLSSLATLRQIAPLAYPT